MKKAFDLVQNLFFNKTLSLTLLILSSHSYAAEGQINKKPTLACEYGWHFTQDAKQKIEGSLQQSTEKVKVSIEEDYISLLEKNSTFQGSNMLKVFNDLPGCKKNINCGHPGRIYMMSANLHQNGKNKYLNLNLCIFGLCHTSVDNTEPYNAELRIEDHGADTLSPYMPSFFMLKCLVE